MTRLNAIAIQIWITIPVVFTKKWCKPCCHVNDDIDDKIFDCDAPGKFSLIQNNVIHQQSKLNENYTCGIFYIVSGFTLSKIFYLAPNFPDVGPCATITVQPTNRNDALGKLQLARMGTYEYQGRITINNSSYYYRKDESGEGASTYIFKDWENVGAYHGWKGTVCNTLYISVTSLM